MFTLMLLIAVKGALIGGHIAKSEINHGIQSGQQQVIVDGIFASSTTIPEDNSSSDLHRSLVFYPSSLDFGAWSIGTAKSYIVTLINKNTNRSVYLSSISGKNPMFYSSFFDDKVVPPLGNTTFNVVFLPRSYGKIETNLFIHTSFGQAKLQVKGEGKECPYRLRSLVGIKAPLNSTIRPQIYMYNPHARPIQILEVYSSGGQFQLELPSGGQEGPQALWEIPPYTSKPIIRIIFHGIQPGNHSAYIRIKIGGGINDSKEGDDSGGGNSGKIGDSKEDVLVIPVDVEILTSRGIYTPNPIIDFGKLTTNDAIKMMKIDLINSGTDRITIIDYKLKNIDNINLITLQETDLTLILNPKYATTNKTYINGVLIIKSQINQIPNQYMELSIDIHAEIYKGSLEYQKNLTIFITKSKNYTRNERNFYVKNTFSVPVLITNITIDNNDTSIFKVYGFQSKVILPNNKRNLLFKIIAINETANYQSILRIITNLTSYELPLIVCTGLLKRYTSIDPINLKKLPDENVLDFGIVPFGDFSNYGYILMTNPNPIPVQLIKWNFTNPRGVYYQSIFMGCAKKTDFVLQSSSTATTLSSSQLLSSSSSSSVNNQHLHQSLPEKFNLCLNLSSSEIAAFELSVQSFNIKSFTGIFKVWTEIEEVVTTVKFVTVMGRLEIDQSRLHFSDCFPGKRCSADISIQSTFLKTMKVASITVSVPELVFEYHTQNGLPEIKANSITDIGRIHFDPKSVCGKKCYIPQDDDDIEISSSTRTIKRQKFNNDDGDSKGGILNFDEIELRRRTDLYRHFKWNLQKITFTLNTSEIRLFEFNSTVDLIWPKLVKGIQVLPPIEIGQTYNGVIIINNPSSKPLNIHLSLSDPKKAKTTSLSLPLEVVEICVYCYLTDEDVFHLNDKSDHIIKPNSFIAIKIRFIGKEAGVYSTLLHIKNNLTLYEAVWITGKAVQPQFRFGNRKPGSQTPLLFEVHEKQLIICEHSDNNAMLIDNGALIAMKRTFTARNTGEVPILIKTFFIGDRMCEGYGFKIFDCITFELKSNTSKKIDIIFTPDFTMARVTIPLILKTNLSYTVNYTLLATVPHMYLESCSKALQRPFWEQHMKRMSFGMLAIAFIFVLIAAFSDSVKVFTDHVQNMSREKGPLQPPLDLRSINAKSGISPSSTVTALSSDEISSSYNNGSIDNEKHFKHHSTIINSIGGASSGNNVKKRNSRRNYLQQSTTQTQILTTNRDKSWSEELTKKFNSHTKLDAQTNNNMHTNNQNIIPSSSSSSSPSRSLNLNSTPSYVSYNNNNSNKISNQNGSSNFNKIIKEEKQNSSSPSLSSSSSSSSSSSLSRKSNRDNTDNSICYNEKNSDLNRNKDEMKIETIQSIELKKPKLSFKKTKSITPASAQNAVHSSVQQQQQQQQQTKDYTIKTTNSNVVEQRSERRSSKGNKDKNETTIIDKKNTQVTSNTTFSSPSPLQQHQHRQTPSSSRNSQNNSPIQNNNSPSSSSSSVKMNSNQRKYGKTPGRERKKEQNNNAGKRNDRKQNLKFKNNAFQFGSPLMQNNSQSQCAGTIAASATANSNMWDQNQISFSHIVAQNLSNGNLDRKFASLLNVQSQQQQQQTQQQTQLQSCSSMSNIETEHDWNEADLKNHETFGTNDIDTTKCNLMDLGPIGTRKSPSSTPVWEPLSPILTIPKSNPLPPSSSSQQHPSASVTNSSFFSSNFPISNSNNNNEGFEYATDNQYLVGAETAGGSIFDHLILENQNQNRWEANNVLLSLLQQPATPANNSGSILRQQNDWQAENRLWTPMGYQDEPNPNGPSSSSSSSLISDQMDVWQRGSSSSVAAAAVRPPPGLGLPTKQQQQHQQQHDNQIYNNNQQLSTHALLTSTLTALAQNNIDNARHMSNNQMNTSAQAFDPFSSLSSIWSNSWHKNNNNNNLNQ